MGACVLHSDHVEAFRVGRADPCEELVLCLTVLPCPVCASGISDLGECSGKKRTSTTKAPPARLPGAVVRGLFQSANVFLCKWCRGHFRDTQLRRLYRDLALSAATANVWISSRYRMPWISVVVLFLFFSRRRRRRRRKAPPCSLTASQTQPEISVDEQ